MTKIRQNFGLFTWLKPGSSVVSANDDKTALVNEGRRVSSKSPSLARAVEEVMSKETDETRFKSFFKSWQLTLKLDSDHTCANAVVAEALAPYPAMILCFLLNHLYTRTFGGKLDIAWKIKIHKLKDHKETVTFAVEFIPIMTMQGENDIIRIIF